MKKYLLATAFALTAGVANAAVFSIDSGTWDSTITSNNNADASVNNTAIYQAGDDVPLVQLGGAPNPAFQWKEDGAPPLPPKTGLEPFTGTFGGTIITDDVTGDVIGGQLVINGTIGDQVIVGTNSWWLRIWEDVTIDLATGLSTVGSTDCARSDFAPANCFPGVTSGQPFAFNISDGAPTPGACLLPGGSNEDDPACGPDGAPVGKATFDAETGLLSLFVEGRSAADNPDGTDLSYEFTLQTTVVPVPAAVWLFGSALGLLGFVRRRLVA